MIEKYYNLFMNILELFEKLVEIIQSSGTSGVVLSCALMSVESIIPMIPLVALITINMMILGKVVGFFVSWFFTCVGCVISYSIFKYGFGKKFDRLTEDKQTINKYKKVIRNISFPLLVLIIAMPLTPAFVVNIVAGILKMDFKKYLLALLIGKLSMVYFLGYFGTSFVESIKNPILFIKMIIIMIIIYGSCYLINKFLKLN